MNMNERIATWNEEAKNCTCGHGHRLVQMQVYLEHGAIQRLPGYLSGQGYRHVTVVYDRFTGPAAGHEVVKIIREAGVHVDEIGMPENKAGDVIADEGGIVQVLLGVKQESQAIIAAGSGTIHDLVRFVCSKMNKPFLSVPTAASVDGFTSAGAPLIVSGVKQTFQAVPPEAIFADVDILEQAPQEMNAAGFGDMLGKYTSLADWVVSRDLGGEPFCPVAYRMTEEALTTCVENIKGIAEGRADGVTVLMDALIVSGISMLIIDHSRPASGGEHHLSHRWEMDLMEAGHKPVLHGAKVGVACALLTVKYKDLAQKSGEPVFDVYNNLPDASQLTAWLEQVGGPTTTEQLGVSMEMVEHAFTTAHLLRDRYTGLKYINENLNVDSK
ncbi:sn-glycerol-1-phosphate dehydrogenase [Paenibacillus taichungensis]|uniref:sn-glycerol-1-phosphate dehydrogenase n=1 Tax=Paenibacillus taichungensis TaxID=484184 RepID=A0A329QZN3_9BACL|nr:sn-glycerol-1-phosphate dehydrogenase [Paenibacillus taichungensis]RAW17259.1 sn-glycerol-1-phosphate dehydrogenase [Paenibacillus taichungensis]